MIVIADMAAQCRHGQRAEPFQGLDRGIAETGVFLRSQHPDESFHDLHAHRPASTASTASFRTRQLTSPMARKRLSLASASGYRSQFDYGKSACFLVSGMESLDQVFAIFHKLLHSFSVVMRPVNREQGIRRPPHRFNSRRFLVISSSNAFSRYRLPLGFPPTPGGCKGPFPPLCRLPTVGKSCRFRTPASTLAWL